jgi:chloride channel 7
MQRYIVPWLIFSLSSGACGLFAGILTTYYGPGAAGSGVAELIGYLNGINYPGFIEFPTLFTKIFGVTFAVLGRLCVGKEGPLAHIGAICGVLVLYIPG